MNLWLGNLNCLKFPFSLRARVRQQKTEEAREIWPLTCFEWKSLSFAWFQSHDQRTNPFSWNAEINNRTNFVRFPFQWHNKYMLNRTSWAYSFCTWSAHNPIFSSFLFLLSSEFDFFSGARKHLIWCEWDERAACKAHTIYRASDIWFLFIFLRLPCIRVHFRCEFYLFTCSRFHSMCRWFFLSVSFSLFVRDSLCTYFVGMNRRIHDTRTLFSRCWFTELPFCRNCFCKTSLRCTRISLIPSHSLSPSFTQSSAQTPGTTK